MSIAWRLEVACTRGVQDHESLFLAWYQERKSQLERSLAATVQNGEFCTESNPLKVFVRNTSLYLQQLYPPWKRQLEQGSRAEGMVRYKHFPGAPFLPEHTGGKNFPQVYCKSMSRREESVRFSDDVIFSQRKKGLFQLVIVCGSLVEVPARESFNDISAWSQDCLFANEATILVEDASIADMAGLDDNMYRVSTAAEFASSSLCNGRPEPKYYDEYRIGKETCGKTYVIVRKDRFIFTACNDIVELRSACEQIGQLLGLRQP